MKKVIVVESAAKTKTIRRFLRGEYEVIACGGHIVDLANAGLGIDVENGFSCIVEPIDNRRIEKLKTSLAGADEIYLATDPDREGESIAADIVEYCIPQNKSVQRIEFNAIVFHAVKEALENPRQINENRVTAQRARRSLDRLIGFILSAMSKFDPEGPHLPSVGRVLSPSVSLVVDRERERRSFIPRTYWTIYALLHHHGQEITAAISGEWDDFNRSKKAVTQLQDMKSMWVYACSEDRENTHHPLPPYTTDTLQDDADRLFGINPEFTMELAQQLYQGVEINGKSQALITYMRTDSTRVSPDGLNLAKKALIARKQLGVYSGRKWEPDSGAQDAHEAIRPTTPENPELFPESLIDKLDENMLNLYRLIYFRFLASQMKPAIYRTTHLELHAGDFKGEAEGHRLISEGFLKIYQQIYPGYGLKESDIPTLSKGTELSIVRVWPETQRTTPPPRYREGALVRELKRRGIGRPSTYGNTLKKIKKGQEGYGYVQKVGKTLRPTDRGEKLCEYLHSRYQQVISYDYTAGMESGLSDIERGSLTYEEFLDREFAWLRGPYEHVIHEGWLDKDKPTPAQIKRLKELAERTETQVPDEAYRSKRKVTIWINKLKQKTTKPSIEISDIEEVDVRGVPCFRVRLFISGHIPKEEWQFLKNNKMKYKKPADGLPPCFQFQRQDYKSVNTMRDGLIEHYGFSDKL